MQYVASFALEQTPAERAFDLVDFIRFSDRCERQYLPVFLLDDMTHQVILMQPLHNDDDRAPLLVVEPRQERVVIPFIDRLTPGFRKRLVRLERIVDDDQVRSAAG